MAEQRVRELERLLIYKEAELARERDKCERAKKKVRQLLAKLSERDGKIAELTLKLEAKASKSGKDPGRVAKQRAQIVAQLEEHLAQMQQDLSASQAELDDLVAKHRSKEQELFALAVEERDPEGIHSLALLGLQVQDRKNSTEELMQKIKELENQLEDQRSMIVEILSGQPRKKNTSEPQTFAPAAPDAPDTPDAALEPAFGPALPGKLRTFLEAAGREAMDLISQNQELLEAFTELNGLGETGFESLKTPEQRALLLSLVAAWAIVTESALNLKDLTFEDEDLQAVVAALDECGKIKEWDMARCCCSENAFSSLMNALGKQPLSRLALGYNTLGLQGLGSILNAASQHLTWASTLSSLSLEMNGFGDEGCLKLVQSQRFLPGLGVLELGWNQITYRSTEALASLLRSSSLHRLGLAGNALCTDGAVHLILAAELGRELELDLSMNSITSDCLRQLVGWASEPSKASQAQAVHLTVNLEWNSIDDPEQVKALAKALLDGGFQATESGQALFQLANNELRGLPASEILDASANLIML